MARRWVDVDDDPEVVVAHRRLMRAVRAWRNHKERVEYAKGYYPSPWANDLLSRRRDALEISERRLLEAARLYEGAVERAQSRRAE